MENAPGDDRTPQLPRPDHEVNPGGVPPPPPTDPTQGRTSGLLMETCYRHPNVRTGVHCTRCGRPICTDCMNAAPVGYQCPECLADARRSGPRRRVRIRFLVGRPGSVTTAILAINIAMFLVEWATGASRSLYFGGSDQKLVNLGAIYSGGQFGPGIVGGEYWRLFTGMFLHAGLIHLAFNMYALYLFGFLIESAFGKVRFTLLYVLCGLMASVTSFAFGTPGIPAVGASGAIFGLLGAWVAFNFRRRQSGPNRFQLQWAAMLIAINLVLGFSLAGVDNLAHVGGLLTGIVAGGLAEGIGPRSVRRPVQVAGFAVIVIVGIALTASRVAALR
jgi:membrane associated rhomboid family serine protease